MRNALLVVTLCVLSACSEQPAAVSRPTAPAVPANRPPELGPITSRVESKMDYDKAGRMTGVTTTVFLETTASDPDGDPLTSKWTATAGTLEPSGLTAKWTGMKKDDEVTLTVSDGKGNTRTHTWKYGKE
jgi:hypothetical protein